VDKVDPLCVEAQGSSFSPARDMAVGGGGERTFSFQVKGEGGTGNIGLKLRREWEGDASAVERYSVTVKVRKHIGLFSLSQKTPGTASRAARGHRLIRRIDRVLGCTDNPALACFDRESALLQMQQRRPRIFAEREPHRSPRS